jgi:5'-3' exonuclease
VLIVDTSYVIFAKYYATLCWYRQNSRQEPQVETILQDPGFQARFGSSFDKSVARVCARFGVARRDVVFAKDCSKSSVWRRGIFPEYKASRAHNGMFNPEVFPHTFQTLLPRLIEANGGHIMGAEFAEADDVIAVVHQYARERMDAPVVILSNDNDCIQLLDDRTHIVNLMMHDVGQRRGALTPPQYLASRVLSGDRSDNIGSIFPRCGMKTAVRMVTQLEPEQLREYIRQRPEIMDKYVRNTTLMDLQLVPPEIRDRVLELLDAAFGAPKP